VGGLNHHNQLSKALLKRISRIVDTMLAELKPKLMEEKSRAGKWAKISGKLTFAFCVSSSLSLEPPSTGRKRKF